MSKHILHTDDREFSILRRSISIIGEALFRCPNPPKNVADRVSVQTVVQDAYNIINSSIKIVASIGVLLPVVVYTLWLHLLQLPVFDLASFKLYIWLLAWVLILLSAIAFGACIWAIAYCTRFLIYSVIPPVLINGKVLSRQLLDTLLRHAPNNSAVTVRAIYTDRLGNSAIQYMYARLFAMHIGANFEAPVLSAPFDKLPLKIDAEDTRTHFVLAIAEARRRVQSACDVKTRGQSLHDTGLEADTASPDAKARLRADKFSGLRKRRKDHLKRVTESNLMACQHNNSNFASTDVSHLPVAAIPCSSDEEFTTLQRESWLLYPVSMYAQDMQLYEPYLDVIRSWMHESVDDHIYACCDNIPTLSKNDLVIHVRLGDILWGHHAAYCPLPASFYRKAIDHFSNPLPTKVVLVSEDKLHPFISYLRENLQQYLESKHVDHGSNSVKPEVKVQSQDILTDFGTLYQSPRLVLSLSTFCWWAAFLGSAEIYYPELGVLEYTTWTPPTELRPPEQSQGLVAMQNLHFLDSEDLARVTYADCGNISRWKGKGFIHTLCD